MIKNLKNKKKKGFTLIELIIVIAIIAILAAIAVPKFGEVRRDANIKSDIANAKNIQSVAVTLLGENDLGTGSYIVGEESNKIASSMQNIPEVKLKKNGEFIVNVGSTGNIIVYINEEKETNQVYPQPSVSNEWYPAD